MLVFIIIILFSLLATVMFFVDGFIQVFNYYKAFLSDVIINHWILFCLFLMVAFLIARTISVIKSRGDIK